MLRKARSLLPGLGVLLVVGWLLPGVAFAGFGPIVMQNIGAEGNEREISATSPEGLRGEGGKQRLTFKFVGESVEIVTSSVQVKGIVYDTKLQAQLKLELKYHEPTLIKPALKECKVVLGESNLVKVFGHLAWKWNGEKKQLEENGQVGQGPDAILTAGEIAEGATELPKGQFMKVVLSGCGVFSGTYKIEGSETGELTPSGLGEWGTTLTLTTTAARHKQHFWNGSNAIGVEPGLTTGEKIEAGLAGEMKMEFPNELAVFGGAGFEIRPWRWRFSSEKEEKTFKIINRTGRMETISTGGIKPTGAAFEVKAGSGCYTMKAYIDGEECPVVIKPKPPLVVEYLEAVPMGGFAVVLARLRR